MARSERLAEWVDEISLNLMALEFRDLELDFTGESLRRVEAELIDEFDSPHGIDDPGERMLVDAAAGYLGETLLRLTGGGWGWRGDEPFIRPDKALGLSPLFPTRLVDRAIDEQNGHVFADAYAQWAETVARHRAAHLSWMPKKKHTSGVDPFQMTKSDAAHVAGWTVDRKAAFPRWASTYGPGTEWNFRPESLDPLEDLLALRTPTTMDLYRPKDPAFVDGAAWYFGEVIRRIRGGRWEYRTQIPGQPNMYTGHPYIAQAGSRELTVPIVALDQFVATGQRGSLHARYLRCGGE